jgi:hypothetical protein
MSTSGTTQHSTLPLACKTSTHITCKRFDMVQHAAKMRRGGLFSCYYTKLTETVRAWNQFCIGFDSNMGMRPPNCRPVDSEAPMFNECIVYTRRCSKKKKICVPQFLGFVECFISLVPILRPILGALNPCRKS